jgi:hypothetical protein
LPNAFGSDGASISVFSVSDTRTPDQEPPEHGHSLLDRLRGTGVGTEDPNIIGDAGPTDVAPGHDPDLPALSEPLPPEEETPAERELPSDFRPGEVVGPDGMVEVTEAGDPPGPDS